MEDGTSSKMSVNHSTQSGTDAQKEEIIRKRQPFNFGIKELKRVLSRMDMPKAEKNRTIRMYKERLYTRIDEVKAKMEEKGLNPLEKLDATDK